MRNLKLFEVIKTLTAIIFFFCVLGIQAQERIDEKLPIIKKQITSLNQAIGWQKNDIGKWVSLKKAIPSKYHDINVEEESFIEYRLYIISVNEIEYTTLVKIDKVGYSFWLFEPTFNYNYSKGDTSLYANKALFVHGRDYNKFSETKLITEIKAKEKEQENQSSSFSYSLDISILYFPSKKAYRFYFGESGEIVGTERTEFGNKYYETLDTNCRIFFNNL